MYPQQLEMAQRRIDFWKSDPVINDGGINSFDGTFQITDITKISEHLYPYLMARFGIEYDGRGFPLKRIEPSAINEVLNEIWEGAGSMAKVAEETLALTQSREFFKQS